MTGGITRWQGQHATGAETQGLIFFVSGDYPSAVSMAFAMEKGLQRFYSTMAQQTDSSENKDLLEHMARLEAGHMAKLKQLYDDIDLDQDSARTDVTEGGFDVEEFIELFGNQLKDIESIIQTGMMFEAQAYDMYTRLSRRTEDDRQKALYQNMADEEQHHLKQLAKELDRRLS